MHSKNTDYGELSSSEPTMQRDLVMILMGADITHDVQSKSAICANNFFVDTSVLLRRIWLLLLEPIAVLESSIPVVRCATVACAAADLTTDTVCLVDLALEIKKRGWIGGAWMFLSDAYRYHLSKEIKKRKEEVDGEDSASSSSYRARGRRREEDGGDLGGQYTGAVVSAVENLGKMSHNISCLMESKSEHEGNDVNKSSSDIDDGDMEVELKRNGGTTPPSQEDDRYETFQATKERSEDEFGEVKKEISQNDGPKDVPYPAKLEELAPTPCNQDEGVGKEPLFSDNGGQQNDNNELMPVLIGGGLALVGAVAGMAMHAANNSREEDKRRKGSPTKSS